MSVNLYLNRCVKRTNGEELIISSITFSCMRRREIFSAFGKNSHNEKLPPLTMSEVNEKLNKFLTEENFNKEYIVDKREEIGIVNAVTDDRDCYWRFEIIG